jgi:hypothetical protein
LITAEHIERQETIFIVIAMKEPLFLIAVNGNVGGIEIEDDPFRG